MVVHPSWLSAEERSKFIEKLIVVDINWRCHFWAVYKTNTVEKSLGEPLKTLQEFRPKQPKVLAA